MIKVIVWSLLFLWGWIVYQAENAPMHDEEKDELKYKEYVTIFGFKLFKRKK